MVIKRKVYLILLLIYLCNHIFAQQKPAVKSLIIPEASITSRSITLLWDKPEQYRDVTGYQVFKDGKIIATSTKTNLTIGGLKPEKKYSFVVKAIDKSGNVIEYNKQAAAQTKSASKVFNVLDYGAKGDGFTKNTEIIQRVINACTAGGTVYIPSGTFLTGALYLKSNITLYIAKGGILKGTADVNDYLPIILNRFEGWELKTFASLINAGTLDRSGKYNVVNLHIQGEGTISGGGFKLGEAMIAKQGKRGRGRLICIMNGQNIDIQGLNIEESPCWNIHYIYSNLVTLHDLNIVSYRANGDGIDPDSSTDSYIFNCTIATDDDCIAIKSGKNPEGNVVNKPTARVRITDCNFIRGAALAIGSEMSGGVSDVFIQDCKIGDLKYGLQIKTTKDRGGYVKNIIMRDCSILKINIVTDVNYNNDGTPAPSLANFQDMEFTNLNMSEAKFGQTIMEINGFPDEQHYTSNIIFQNISLPAQSTIKIKHTASLTFKNVWCNDGTKPVYEITESKQIEN